MNILLSISILVSNRKDQIRKTMNSLEPLRKAIPSELIVVDTVGEENSDGSLAITKEYADKVIRFPWCNDFAAARNAGLKAAEGEWFLYLDDDEWFENVTEFIRFFASGEYAEYDRGWYLVRNYTNRAGTGYADGYVDRMCRRTPETKFYGKIHECILPMGEKIKKFSAYVHHYGYVYDSEEDRKNHAERNISLLEQCLKETPGDIRLAGQLIQEYIGINRFREAAEYCCSVVNCGTADVADSFVQYLLVMQFRIEIYRENWDAAEAIYNEYLQRKILKELPAFVCITELIKLEERREKYEQVLIYVKEYLEQRRSLIARENDYMGQAVFDFLDYLSEKKEKEIVEAGIHAIAQTGDCDMAKELFDRVNWLNQENRPYGPMCWLVEWYEKTGMDELFYSYANLIMKNPEIREQFVILVDNMQLESKRAIRQLFSVIEEADPIIKQYLLQGRKAEAAELLTCLQETVITLGNQLEKVSAQGDAIIPDLECCCELIWQCFVAGERDIALVAFDKAMQLLRKVKEKITL